jgi:hypothetical protein
VRRGDDVKLKGAKSAVLKREGLLADDDAKALTTQEWIKARVVANISTKQVEVEKETLDKVGDGLTPVYT